MWQSLIQSREHNKYTSLKYNTGILWHNTGAQQWNLKKTPRGGKKSTRDGKNKTVTSTEAPQSSPIFLFEGIYHTLRALISWRRCVWKSTKLSVWYDVKGTRWMCSCFTSDDHRVTDVKPLEPKTEFSNAGENAKCLQRTPGNLWDLVNA